MTLEQAIKRGEDLIETCKQGMEFSEDYRDVFLTDRTALEILIDCARKELSK